MTVVYLGLGSNLDDPITHLRTALEDFTNHKEIIILNSSSFYNSAPQGPQDQPNFINSVVKLETSLSAHILLSFLLEIERKHGRERGARWGPRTLDLDILLFGDMIINDDTLSIPHPHMAEREFVLVPLVEIEPEIEIPGLGSARNLISELGDLTIQRIAAH